MEVKKKWTDGEEGSDDGEERMREATARKCWRQEGDKMLGLQENDGDTRQRTLEMKRDPAINTKVTDKEEDNR